MNRCESMKNTRQNNTNDPQKKYRFGAARLLQFGQHAFNVKCIKEQCYNVAIIRLIIASASFLGETSNRNI